MLLAAFAQAQEGRHAGRGEQGRGDRHAPGDELRRSLALRLRPADIGQAGAQADQAAEIAPSPRRRLGPTPPRGRVRGGRRRSGSRRCRSWTAG